jgi:hypothetical protein
MVDPFSRLEIREPTALEVLVLTRATLNGRKQQTGRREHATDLSQRGINLLPLKMKKRGYSRGSVKGSIGEGHSAHVAIHDGHTREPPCEQAEGKRIV